MLVKFQFLQRNCDKFHGLITFISLFTLIFFFQSSAMSGGFMTVSSVGWSLIVSL